MKNVKLISFITVLILLLSPALFPQQKAGDEEAYQLLKNGKDAVYKKDWQRAVDEFKKLTNKYKDSKYFYEALYWTGYSMAKLSETLRELDDQLKMKRMALETLKHLYSKQRQSEWADDAQRLQIEIARELYESGLYEYKSMINGWAGIQKEEDPELELKLVALNALMTMDEEKAFPILEKMIKDEENPKLRERALIVLYRSKNPKVVPLMMKLATKDPDISVREKAMAFFLSREKGIESLIKIYDSSEEKEMKERLISYIASKRSQEARDKLLSIAKTEKDKDLQQKAVIFLGQFPESADALIDIYDKTQNKELKQRIILSLGQSRSQKARDKLLNIAKTDKDPETRERAIIFLYQYRSADELIEIYDTMDNPKMKMKIIAFLSQIRDEKARQKILSIAKNDKDPEVRRHAIPFISHSQSVDDLIDIYDSTDDQEIKERIIMFLPQAKDKKGREKLLDIAMNEKNAELREKAIMYLTNMGGMYAGEAGDMAEEMVKIYDSTDDTKLKQKIIMSLSNIKAEESVKKLIEIGRKEKDLKLKKLIIQYLSYSKSEEAAKFLKEIIEEK